MSKNTDLMAFGFPAIAAGALGYTPISITAAGSTQAAGTVLPPDSQLFLVTTSTAGAAAVTLSSNIASTTPVWVINLAASGVTASVFCATGQTLNGTTNGSVLLTTGQSALFVQTTGGSSGTWYAIKTA